MSLAALGAHYLNVRHHLHGVRKQDVCVFVKVSSCSGAVSNAKAAAQKRKAFNFPSSLHLCALAFLLANTGAASETVQRAHSKLCCPPAHCIPARRS